MTRSEAKQIALEYIRRDVRLILLGSGVDGFVFSDEEQTVYKVFDNREKYERECTVYVKLLERSIHEILGLNIPTLVDSHPDLMVIEMSSVQPPFLLDFASVLFEPPDFEKGVYAGWHDRMYFRFGGNTWFVVAVYNALAAMGLHYMDMHRGNLNFTGIAGIDESDFGPEDEATPV